MRARKVRLQVVGGPDHTRRSMHHRVTSVSYDLLPILYRLKRL
jgi:hypothetical protein